MYDLIIVGGGPAGASAAVYAARKRLKTLLIVEEWGGQSTVSPDIQNWIGTPSISGTELAKNLQKHVESYAGEVLTVVKGRATTLVPTETSVDISLAQPDKKTGQKDFQGKTLLIASGAKRRKLDVPGAAEYDNKGLTYCATCDGPLYDGKDVAVVGGGNAAFESALQLVAYCKHVTLLNRSEIFRADAITVSAAMMKGNLTLVKNAIPVEVMGEQFVTGIKYRDAVSNAETLLPSEGIFVEIGLIPNTEWIGGVTLNAVGQVIVDHRTQKTSHPRVWAAGDVTDGAYHQNNIAAGEAVTALEDIYMFVHREGASDLAAQNPALETVKS